VLLSFAVLLPGLVLAAIGLGTLREDRSLVDQQVRGQLDSAAARVREGLSRELTRWDDAVAGVGRSLPAQAGPQLSLPPLIQRALDAPGSGALVITSTSGTVVTPPGALAYALAVPGPIERPKPARLAAAERKEYREHDAPRAIDAYRALSASPDPALRAAGLAGLARVLRNAGRREEALAAYTRLQGEGRTPVGVLPARLIALDARCEMAEEDRAAADLARLSAELYGALVEGRWMLEKERYTFYAGRAEKWYAASAATPAAIDSLRQREAEKVALTTAADRWLAASRDVTRSGAAHSATAVGGRVMFAFAIRATDESTALLVLGPAAISNVLGPTAFRDGLGEDLRGEWLATDGEAVYRSSAETPSTDAGALVGRADWKDGDQFWRIRVWPKDPDAPFRTVRTRRNLYVALVVLACASLVAGTALTFRTLRRDLAVSQLKSQFVSAVSHEFRSPLAGIRQLSDMLVRGRVPDKDKRAQYYLMIRRESDRLSRLVENVLDFARMEDGRREYRFDPIDTAEWLGEVASDFQDTLAAGQRTLAVSIQDGLPGISGDRTALTTAVQNLLDNAAKYSPESPTVWLEAAEDGERVAIRVRDQGVGIPKDEQPRVFDRFYRGRELADVVKGTGLGLSLVQHIVRAHGGSVELQSRPGEGSTFTILLPASVRHGEASA
jgi:signal transduction histidine kinase